MCTRIFYSYLLIIVALSINRSFANDTVIFRTNSGILEIGKNVKVFEDKSRTTDFKNIVTQEFTATKGNVPNLGISKSAFWVKFTLKNDSYDENLFINLSLPTMDFVEFYFQDETLAYNSTQVGEHLPFWVRKYNDPDYIFKFNIPKDSCRTFYFKVKSNESIQLPVFLGSEKDILERSRNKGMLSGIYFGVMLVIIFYNLFIYFSVRDKSYVFYVVYVLFTFLTQTSLQGYTFQFLWPNMPEVAKCSLFVLPIFTGITGLLFMKVFLEIKTYVPVLRKVVYLLFIPYLISLSFLVLGNYKLSQMVMEINAMIVSVFMLITPIIVLKRGFKPAKFFLIAWSVFLVGVCIYILKDLGILPFNNLTRYTMQIGSAIETILLSFALADRMNNLKREKENSQRIALETLEENKKLIMDQNLILEQGVEIRTIELKEINEELKHTLMDLQDAQAQLVNSEKMASLGQLTAGIAHEINNPINFVSANIKPLKMDIADTMELISKYEKIRPCKESMTEFTEVEDFRKRIDIEYLKGEMESLLNGIEDGAKRTAEIVSGLRNFSRLDESEKKLANLNDGLESTLILLRNTIPPEIKLVEHYGPIPLIECLPGKLNQVFMNVLANAIYAVKMKKAAEEKCIIVSTYCEENYVCVSIGDSGVGMTEETKNKIFDPFYTTKDVGEGTGLGMSIVYKIIESHNGKIEVASSIGFGTKIILKLLNNPLDER